MLGLFHLQIRSFENLWIGRTERQTPHLLIVFRRYDCFFNQTSTSEMLYQCRLKLEYRKYLEWWSWACYCSLVQLSPSSPIALTSCQSLNQHPTASIDEDIRFITRVPISVGIDKINKLSQEVNCTSGIRTTSSLSLRNRSTKAW